MSARSPSRRRSSTSRASSTPTSGRSSRPTRRGREDARSSWRVHAPGRPDRPLPSRAMGRHRLPRRPRRRADPARGPHHQLLRQLERDAHGPRYRKRSATTWRPPSFTSNAGRHSTHTSSPRSSRSSSPRPHTTPTPRQRPTEHRSPTQIPPRDDALPCGSRSRTPPRTTSPRRATRVDAIPSPGRAMIHR